MKRIYRKIFKSKKPSLGSNHGPGPVASTLTSTLITSTTDLIPSVPVCDTIASTQVTAGVSVSVFSFVYRIFKYGHIFIEQTAHNIGVSTLVSALETSDLPPVSVRRFSPTHLK